MTQFIKQPGMVTIAPDFSGITIDKVPAGYYRIACAPGIGFHLVPIEPLQVADKIYGSLLKHIPRIEEVWEERKGVPTTVLLEGLKGSGKSLLMKTLAKRFVEQHDGIVLLCNVPYTGDDFFEFLQQITQKKIVLMDEFDKVYKDTDARNNILTLLDGTMASHTLFVLTMNASSGSKGFEFFHNRPGRVFFNISFKGVDYEAIQAYLEDQLADKSKLGELMTFVKRFTQFNMDMLGTLVREVNACPDVALEDIAVYLNTKPDITLDDIFFDYKVLRNGVDVSKITTGLSSAAFKVLLKGLQDPSREECINPMGTRSIVWNETENREYNPVTDKDKGHDLKHGAMLKDKKTLTFMPYWDDYIYSRNCTMVQDPATGVLTITGYEDDADERDENSVSYVFILTPVMYPKYSMAF
ncbi:AAA family ATPase [Acinetobacter phage nACB1]|nr:AAA family ATPase [Acinetobacter phage nACB1]